MERLNTGYLSTIATLMFVLPVASIGAAVAFGNGSTDRWDLVGAWFVFWAVGVRLLAAGIKQSTQPAFTAEKIFGITSGDSHVIVRELGFANICMGLAGVISLFVSSWRTAAAFVGGLYFGIAGAMHVVKRPSTHNEWIALVSDLFIFIVMASYLVHVALALL